MKTITASVAGFLLVGSTALAQQAAPKPAAEMSQVKYYAGAWTCAGDAPAGPFGPAHKTQTSLTLKSDLDGFWYAGMMT